MCVWKVLIDDRRPTTENFALFAIEARLSAFGVDHHGVGIVAA
jgi:hypothetical protein